MNIVVLGGSGMLGSMVVKVLQERGHCITAVERSALPEFMKSAKEARWPNVINCIGAIPQRRWSRVWMAEVWMAESNGLFPHKLRHALDPYVPSSRQHRLRLQWPTGQLRARGCVRR